MMISFDFLLDVLLTLLHSEGPKLWSFGTIECNRVNGKMYTKENFCDFLLVDVLLTLLHSDGPKLYGVLALLGAIGAEERIAPMQSQRLDPHL